MFKINTVLALFYSVSALFAQGAVNNENDTYVSPRRVEGESAQVAFVRDVLIRSSPDGRMRRLLPALMRQKVCLVFIRKQRDESRPRFRKYDTRAYVGIGEDKGVYYISLVINKSFLEDKKLSITDKQLVLLHEFIHVIQRKKLGYPYVHPHEIGDGDMESYLRASATIQLEMEFEAYEQQCQLSQRLADKVRDKQDFLLAYEKAGREGLLSWLVKALSESRKFSQCLSCPNAIREKAQEILSR